MQEKIPEKFEEVKRQLEKRALQENSPSHERERVITSEIIELVSKYGREDMVIRFGRLLLKVRSAKVENIMSGVQEIRHLVAKCMVSLEAWLYRDGRSDATLDRLLKVCHKIDIGGVVEMDLRKVGLL
eukprot:m.247322 g.247322  ORF g.247322 m.247322 type:complete len:128 (+) comp40266_c0_seq10:688-1071(+)